MSDGTVGSDWTLLTEEHLVSVQPLLSPESSAALQAEIVRVKHTLTPAASDEGVPLHYDPRNVEECYEKLRLYKERQSTQSRLCFLYELSEKCARQQVQRLTQENEALRQENSVLQIENQRLKRQVAELLGIRKRRKKTSAPGGPEEERVSPEETASVPATSTPRRRGAPLGHRGKTRPIPDHVDREEIFEPPQRCEHCGSQEVHSTDSFDEKYIEDLPVILPQVTLRKYRRGECAHCGQVVRHPEATQGPPVETGANLAVHLAAMRQTLGVSYRKLAQFSTETFGLPLSPPGVFHILRRVTQKMEGVYTGIESSLPHQKILHADETGWKMDGQRWQLWCFCNKHLAYFHADKSRAAQVVKDRLGEDFPGTVHCDFYAAYNFLPQTQRCLVHLNRTLQEELELFPEDPFLQRLHTGVKTFLHHGKEHTQTTLPADRRTQSQRELQRELNALLQLNPPDGSAKTLVARLHNHRESLLRFAEDPDIEFHNNRAERQLRPAVLFRKVSFGNRTPEGARGHSILSTVLQTCRLQGKDVRRYLHRLLEAPPTETSRLTRELLDTA